MPPHIRANHALLYMIVFLVLDHICKCRGKKIVSKLSRNSDAVNPEIGQ